jgi:ATP-dependent protease ClpP protease subunit
MYSARPLRSTRRLQNLAETRPKWWTISNKANLGEPSMVSIYDEIGMLGVSAGDFLAELSGVNGDLDVHINSPGGDVFDAIAIYNTLKGRKGTVSVVIDGLAASAASFIAQAASPGCLEMAPHAEMMIHDGFAMGIGNAADMRGLAEQLDRASDNIAAIYADRSGKSASYWREKMKAETWYSDQGAVIDGLADRVRGQGNPRNAWDLSVYNSSNAKPLGDGWVQDPDGTCRFDPDGDGDDDSTPEGDTDHDYFDESGKQIKPIPPCPTPKKSKAKSDKKLRNADVDNSPWDASKAWHSGAQSDDPAAFYRGICAAEKTTGDPATQDHWALPYKYHPGDAPNAAGVRNALARLSQTHDLKDADAARATLEAAMKKINPDYSPGDTMDPGLLCAVFGDALKGAING